MLPFLGILLDKTKVDQVFELQERNDIQSLWVLGSIVVGALLITVVRYLEPRSFLIMLQNSVLFYSPEDQQKEGDRLNRSIHFLLLFNFFLMCITGVIWNFFKGSSLDENQQWWWVILAPFIFSFYQFFTMYITGWISSRRNLAYEINFLSINLLCLYGIIAFGVIFAAFFFKGVFPFYFQLLLWSFGVIILIRFIRSVILAFQKGVAWYQIILYLWTLEILPLLVIFRLIYHVNVWEIS